MSAAALDIAISVYRLLAAGGLERHALRLAEALVEKGNRVTIYTTGAGEIPDGVTASLVPRRGLSNHGRLANFADDLARLAQGQHDLLVGFQKMPGLDMLFCCDWCFAERDLSTFARLLPRYRTMAALEAACCDTTSKTQLLMLAEPQAKAYREAYDIAPGRITVLPPTLDRRKVVQPPTPDERRAIRAAMGIVENETAWLWIGLQPQVKGLDRAIRALALSADARLMVCGADPERKATRAALALARRLGCADRIQVSGMVSDAELARHQLVADLLMHPARLDVTGTVIVEALGAGLPVIVTENCGYSPHVAAADAGVVVSRDATPEMLAAAAAVSSDMRQKWSRAARDYVGRADLTSGISAAASLIENAARVARTGGARR